MQINKMNNKMYYNTQAIHKHASPQLPNITLTKQEQCKAWCEVVSVLCAFWLMVETLMDSPYMGWLSADPFHVECCSTVRSCVMAPL